MLTVTFQAQTIKKGKLVTHEWKEEIRDRDSARLRALALNWVIKKIDYKGKDEKYTEAEYQEAKKYAMNDKILTKGTCQNCGREQKLPKGVLAKHGYTREYGFFNGTCIGSGYPPYEVTCKDIPYFVRQYKEHAKILEARIEQIKADSSDETEMSMYNPRTRKYEIEKVTITDTSIVTKQGESPLFRYSYTSKEDALKKLRQIQIKRIEAQLKNIKVHIEWQEARIRTWK